MDALRDLIARSGPIAVSTYLEHALYDPAEGFYSTHGMAGRRGDFLTAPEVGPLFGAVIARAVDTWWDDLGRPDPFTVVDWGAGPGTLERSVIAAEPDCLTSGALRLVAVEVSDAQRAHHPEHPAVVSTTSPDLEGIEGVIVANELLDNLPFDIVERTDHGWSELRIDVDGGRFVTVVGETAAPPGPGLAAVAPGVRLPVQSAAQLWLDRALALVSRGRVVVLDYGAELAELANRPDHGWIRTHRGHDHSTDWLTDPGSCDITTDVAFDLLAPAPDEVVTQAEFLRRHGIDGLVDEGRRMWEHGAATGDLAALTARSRIREAEALLDPDGMGGFVVATWQR